MNALDALRDDPFLAARDWYRANADLLDQLGLDPDDDPVRIERALADTGIEQLGVTP